MFELNYVLYFVIFISYTTENCQGYRYQPSASTSSCIPSVTTVIGTHAPVGTICSGQLLLNDEFDQFNHDIWKNEISIGGGGNNEFQWYVNDQSNSHAKAGKLILKPSLTIDVIGNELEDGYVKLDPCTNSNWNGCEHQATKENIMKPVRSARVHTLNTFAFKYGILEITAKMPAGDWLWPALWLLPQNSTYGEWPRSGEIDLLESRGNRAYTDHQNQPIGVERFSSTLHFGPRWDQNAWPTSTFSTNSEPGRGFNSDFHKYKLKWTPQSIAFFLDGSQVGNIPVGDGFWKRGNFNGDNLWAYGTKMAPFDQEFYIIMNLAIGGTNGYFPDNGNVNGKPWANAQANAHTAFWKGRDQWLNSWKLHENGGNEASLMIDSVKVWAL